ncbi:hypothetical protein Tco_0454778 [Tanacetum coccineum]
MSSYTHPSIPSNYDVKDAFSSINAPNYISTPPSYSLVTPGNITPDSSDDLTKDLLSSLSIFPFHDDPYMKVIQAYDAIPPPQVIIALPAIVPPPMFNTRYFFPLEEISSPKDIETHVDSPIPISLSLICMDIAKISRKRSKPDNHGHGNRIECAKAGRMLSKVNRSTDIAKISRKRSKPDNHGHGNGIECAKAGRMLSKPLDQLDDHTDCQRGNPCDHQVDPRAKIRVPIIERNEWTRLRGAYN